MHFGRDQISWECRTCDRCETFPTGIPAGVHNTPARFKGSDISVEGENLRQSVIGLMNDENEESDDDGDASLNGYYVWSRLLEKYCQTNFTNESDKLVAISGLARQTQKEIGDDYVVGLWKSILPSQLLWRVGSFVPAHVFYADDDMPAKLHVAKPRASRPAKGWRAPTWSWASIEGGITTSRPSRKGSLIRIIDHIITPTVAGMEMGQLRAAVLLLSGALHFSIMMYVARNNHWFLLINPRGKRVARPPEPAWKDVPSVPTPRANTIWAGSG